MQTPSLLTDLFVAYYQARKNKRNTINQLAFEINYEANLIQLYNDIVNKQYAISPSSCFMINKPVQREIFAASFRDRVVHHLLFNYINPTFEAQFIQDSYSCRKQKGTHYGINRLNNAIKTCSKNYTQDCYVLKLDIQSYFMSINKTILQQKLMLSILKSETITPATKTLSFYLIDTILADNPTKNCVIKGKKTDWQNLPKNKSLFYAKPNCGLPIGNLTSQLFSNVYLHSFDCFMKTDQNLEFYGRYVDDFFVLHTRPEKLKEIISTVKAYLQNTLALTLHPKKIVLQHYSKGVNFLGATIKPYRMYVSNRTKINFKHCILHWERFLKHHNPTISDLNQMRAAINSYLGILGHYRSYNIRHKLLLKNRSKLLYKYGYVFSIRHKKMTYVLKQHNILVQAIDIFNYCCPIKFSLRVEKQSITRFLS
ncbi:MAG: reverse transcriptase/maturase family protein [Chitinophagales bacterium]